MTTQSEDTNETYNLGEKSDNGFMLKATDDGTVDLDIFDVIGESVFGGGVSAKSIAKALEPHKSASQINVRINSPGGSAFDGTTIYNLLSSHSAEVRIEIDGLAASAASIISMAGDEITMAENALLMIHNAQGFTMGDRAEHSKQAQTLGKLDTQIARTYAARSGSTIKSMREAMDAETWYTAEEAIEAGLATSVQPAKAVAASFSSDAAQMYRHVPQGALQYFKPGRTIIASAPIPQKGRDDMETATDDRTPADAREQFANEHGDIVEAWKAEGFANGHIAATEECGQRCKELADAFEDHPAFVLAQILAGSDVAKAKSDYANTLFDELKVERQKTLQLEKQLQSGGAPDVTLDPTASIDEQSEQQSPLPHDEQVNADWDADKDDCNDRFKNLYAYTAYRQSIRSRDEVTG